MKNILHSLIHNRFRCHLSRLLGLCLLGLLPGMLSAQDKPTSFEQQPRKATITVNGQEVEISGHNNVNKLIRMNAKSEKEQGPIAGLEDIQSRDLYEWMMLRDPRTNEIPANIREQELLFAQKLSFEQGPGNAGFAVNDSTATPWTRRGPYNVGGRTRAMAIDFTDSTRILAGGVSGGMWLSEDGGYSWRKTTDPQELQSVTAIAQDVTDSTGQTWYYGSGEIRGNSAAANGAPFRGNGMWKSVDGGRSWQPMESTKSNTPHVFDPGFDYVHNIAIDPTNGDLWVAAFANIFHSQDDGITWDTAFYSGGTWTDIDISSRGDIYATLGISAGPDWGVYWKPAQDTAFQDITPAEFALGNLSRTKVSIAPSNEDVAYFLAETPGSGVLSATLMKFEYSADTAVADWVDLSANVPAFGGSVGNYNSQGAYNMVLEVLPSDENVVFVGGTNLYRSTDGFASDSTTTWIGGYGTANNVSLYANQHPDQHVLRFYPGTNAAISANDGGLYRTENILENEADADPVNWEDLNRGYYTTQPYAISIDPTAEQEDLLIAGFQDNGTWSSHVADPEDFWSEEFGGDGSYNAIADGGRARLVSSQNGNAYVFYYENGDEEAGDYFAWTQVRPPAAGFSFINPFILDPNNDRVLYVASSSGVWRNSDYSQIPLFTNGSTVNWSLIPGSDASFGTVTALEASTLDPNIFYFGTSGGQVWRVDNVHTGSPITRQVGSDFLGSVSSIAVDPDDADRIIVTLSNYNVRSVFYSEDGGATYTDISGNLEEAADGVGPGPSVRWAEMMETDEGPIYMVGTSTGLYTTHEIATDTSGVSEVVWEQQSEDLIGNAVVYNSAVRHYDGRVAIATHANGMYETTLPVTPEDRIFANAFEDVEVILGWDSLVFSLEGLFEDEGEGNSPIEVSLYENSDSTIVQVTLDSANQLMYLVFNDSITGSAGITLAGTSDGRVAFSSFGVSIEEFERGYKNIFDQVTNPGGPGITSQVFTDLGSPIWSADDFEVPAGESWDIQQVFAPGSKNTNPIDDVVVQFWLPSSDSTALPEIIIFSDTVQNDNGPNDGNMLLTLRETLTLDSGYYWVSITPILPFAGNAGRWFWNRTTEGFGNQYHLIDPANLFGAGLVNWTAGEFFNADFTQLNFALNGVSSNAAPTDPVQGPFATTESPYDVSLNWQSGPDDVGYNIYASEDGVNFELAFVQAAEASNSFDFEDLDPNTGYYFGIETIDILGDTTEMAIDSAYTWTELAFVTEPLDVSSTSFEIDWSEVDAGAYVFQVADGNGFGTDSLLVVNQTIDITEGTGAIVDGLDPARSYEYRVGTVNDIDVVNFSEEQLVQTLPSTPTGLETIDLADDYVVIQWDLNDSSEFVNEYYVYGAPADEDLELLGSVEADTADIANGNIAVELDSLESNSAYTFAVTASSTAVGVKSDPASIDVLTFPEIPNVEDATDLNSTGFTANWSEVSTEYYKVDVATDSAFTSIVIDDLEVDGTETSAEIDSLNGATTYYYRVAAGNDSGVLGYSDGVGVLTLPDAPDGIEAAISAESISLTWEETTGEVDGYTVYKGTDANSLVEVDIVQTTDYEDSGLDANTEYFYGIAAFNDSGESDVSTFSVTTLPDTPTATAATDVTGMSFTANWEEVSAAYYLIDVATDSSFANLVVDGLEVNGTDVSATIDSLSSSTTYFYRVAAGNDSGTSDLSNTIELLTLPAAPTNFATSDLSNNVVTISWDAASGITGYKVYRGTTADSVNQVATTTETSYTDSTLVGNTQYFYEVKSYNDSGVSEALTGSVLSLPDAPTADAATDISASSFVANWSGVSGDSVKIDVALDASFDSLVVDGRMLAASVDSSTVSDLSSEFVYYYRVAAINTSGMSAYSNTATATTLPDAPTNFVASAITSTSVTIGWDIAVEGDAVDGYRIFRGTSADALTEIDTTNVNTYDDAGLSGNTSYFYEVKAYNVSGTSAALEGSVLTAPNTPVATDATDVSNTSLQANWTGSAASFTFDFASDSAFTNLLIADSVLTGNSIVINNLSAANEYFYRVSATNSSGTTGDSDAISVTTAITAPQNLAITDVTETGATAGWDAVDGVTDYNLDLASDADFTSLVVDNETVSGTSFSFSALTEGTPYFVRVRAVGGTANSDYSATSEFTTNLSDALSTERLNKAVEVYPNPASTSTVLFLNDAFSGKMTIELINVSGQVLETMNVEKAVPSMEVELKLESLSKGLYFIHISTDSGKAVKRLLKQ